MNLSKGSISALLFRRIFASLVFCSALLHIFPAQAQIAYAGTRRVEQDQPQPSRNETVTLNVRNEKLSVVLEKIQKQTGVVFVYANDEVDVDQRVSINVTNKNIVDVSRQLLQPLGISFILVKDKIVLQPGKDKSPLAEGSSQEVAQAPVAAARNLVFAQISGKVTDATGKPVSAASVTVKGTNIGTVTDNAGNFSLNIPDDRLNDVLVVTSVGFTTREIPIQGRSVINISLTEESTNMNEVVVVAYGTQRRVSVTGAVDAVTSKAIDGRPVANVASALQGTSPNLIIQQRNFEPGQPVNINIRGLGTLGDNTPLVVIDGIIGGDINLINPVDIESVSVLRDAGSAAIYGSRSANGVILITTKKGRKNERATVSYSGMYGIQSPRVTYDPVSAWRNAYYKNESLVNSGLPPAYSPDQIQEFAARGDGDWRVNSLLQNAPQQAHTVTLRGGSATNTYLLSLGYFDQRNNFVGPDYGYKRYNVRFNQTTDIGKLKLSTILSYVKVYNKDHSYNSSTLIVDAGRVPLFYSFQDSAGNYLTNPVSAQFNPKGILERGGYRNSNNDEVFGNLSLEYPIGKDFKIRGVAGGTVRRNATYSRVLQVNFQPGGVYGDNREVYNVDFNSLFTNLQLIAEYNKSFGKHNLTALVGGSNESYREETSALFKTFTDPALGIPTTGTIVDPARSFNSNGTNSFNGRPATIETSINSVFGRLGYSFNDKYFAEVNFRYDGSSKFASANRWGFFPSAAVAWRLTEEAFMDNFRDKVGDLKLRASYGILGNQNVNAYQYQTTFFNYPSAYGFNNVILGGAGYTLGNPQLTWEKAATLNFGVDATLLKRKLMISFDLFDKRTRDILYVRRDVPQLFGAGFPDFNVAEVRNRGWELKATYNMNGKLFQHSFMLNVADNLNELLSLTSGATEQIERREEYEFLRRVGQPITAYYGYRTNGYFQNLDDLKGYPTFAGSNVSPGDLKFVDRNKDNVIDDQDKFILGNPFPRYTFGFTYTVAVKGFDLSVFVQGVGKRDQMIRGELVEPFHVGYSGTMYTHQTDYWTPTNPNARWPKLAENGSASNQNNYRTGSDLYLFDAAYARLKNLQIGYSLPQSLISKIKLQKARIYFTGQNLLTLSRLNFLDPENTEFDNNTSLNTGANSGRAYFMPVFYGFGLDVTF